MATLTRNQPALTAAVLGATAAANAGDQFLNDGRQLLYVKNVNAATRTITIATGATILGLAIGDVSFTVVQNAEKIVGPFDPRWFNDSSGYVQVTYSSETDVTVAVISV